MFTSRLTGFALTLLSSLDAAAQTPEPPVLEPAPAEAPAQEATDAPSHSADPQLSLGVGASVDGTGSDSVAADDLASDGTSDAALTRTGFEAGMRLGFGVPLGKAGEDLLGTQRDVSDLTPWRAPLWLDVGYRASESTTLGLYVQVGVGGNGDACGGECDWSDIRIGAQGQWRLAPGSSVDPWVGIGVGYESLTFRTLQVVSIEDPEGGPAGEASVRTSERIAGPELLLQGGIDFQVEDSLSIGPYASATLGQYLSDDFKCRPSGAGCPESSLTGSGFHSWLGIGVRGSYAP